MKLTTLDHVFIFGDKGPSVAAREAVALARRVEEIGYHRYWISENHGIASGCGSPEILVAAAAEATGTIRVGTATVLLPYYPPWKVATTFNLLTRLHGPRIDLGIGRGAGGTKQVVERLEPVSEDAYDDQITAVLDGIAGYGNGPMLPAAPAPDVWLMSFSENGARTAARHGLPFCLGQWFHDDLRGDILDIYRDAFQPSTPADRPRTSVCVLVACADDPGDAAALETLIDLTSNPAGVAGRAFPVPRMPGFPSWEELRTALPVAVANKTYRTLIGSPSMVEQLLGDLIDAYRPDELAIATVCPDFELRVRMLEIVAEILHPVAVGS